MRRNNSTNLLMKREVKYEVCDEELKERSTASNSSESEMDRDGKKKLNHTSRLLSDSDMDRHLTEELNRTTRLLSNAGNSDHSSGEEDLPEKRESTPRNEREIQSLNGNVSDGNRPESSAEVSDASTINYLSQNDKRETENGQEPSDGDFVPPMTEQKAKHVISLSNHSVSEDGHESETKLNATVSSESDVEYQLMRKMMKRKKRIMDSDPSSDAEFIKQKKKKSDTETSSQNEYESSESDSGDKKTGQKKTFMKKRYRRVTKSKLCNRVNYRNYSTGSDDNSEKVSSQSESDESDQQGKSKNIQNTDPGDTSDVEEKSLRRENKKDDETSSCDARQRESRDKDDSTSQESSDSEKGNKTKSLIKNGIKVTSRIPRHYRIRSRKRRPRSPTDDSERTDSAEEDATDKVSGIKGKKMPCMQEKVFTDRKGI